MARKRRVPLRAVDELVVSFIFFVVHFFSALQHADVVVLLGARLNWMLHFGQPPRFSADVKIIQVFWQDALDIPDVLIHFWK